MLGIKLYSCIMFKLASLVLWFKKKSSKEKKRKGLFHIVLDFLLRELYLLAVSTPTAMDVEGSSPSVLHKRDEGMVWNTPLICPKLVSCSSLNEIISFYIPNLLVIELLRPVSEASGLHISRCSDCFNSCLSSHHFHCSCCRHFASCKNSLTFLQSQVSNQSGLSSCSSYICIKCNEVYAYTKPTHVNYFVVKVFLCIWKSPVTVSDYLGIDHIQWLIMRSAY